MHTTPNKRNDTPTTITNVERRPEKYFKYAYDFDKEQMKKREKEEIQESNDKKNIYYT